jgi:hypothetical protein
MTSCTCASDIERGAVEFAQRLTARMVDLHPEVVACRRSGAGEGAQRLQATVAIDHHIAGPLEVAAVDLDVAGDQEPGTTLGPQAVEAFVLVGGAVHAVGKTFGHGGLGDPVGQHGPAGQGQGLGQQARHGRSGKRGGTEYPVAAAGAVSHVSDRVGRFTGPQPPAASRAGVRPASTGSCAREQESGAAWRY